MRVMLATFSRNQFLRRSVGAIGGTAALIALGTKTPVSNASTPNGIGGTCSVFGTFYNCRTGYGPPSCTKSEVTVYSPNDAYWGKWDCTCPGFCDCSPQYFQIQLTVCNSGGCNGVCVA
jgi:hypothetical protein